MSVRSKLRQQTETAWEERMNLHWTSYTPLALLLACGAFVIPAAVAAPIFGGTYIVAGTSDTDIGALDPTGIAGTLVWDGTGNVPDGLTGTSLSLLGTSLSWTGPDWIGYMFSESLLTFVSLSQPSVPGSHEFRLDFTQMRWSVGAPGDWDTNAYAGDFTLARTGDPVGPSVPEPSAFALLGAGLCALMPAGHLKLRRDRPSRDCRELPE
jgi:hypothetical protein